jgi:hypothetical protein
VVGESEESGRRGGHLEDRAAALLERSEEIRRQSQLLRNHSLVLKADFQRSLAAAAEFRRYSKQRRWITAQLAMIASDLAKQLLA